MPAQQTSTSRRPNVALDLRDGLVHVGGSGHVGGERASVAVRSAARVSSSAFEVEERDARATRREARRRRRADPARAARDQRDATAEVVGVRHAGGHVGTTVRA